MSIRRFLAPATSAEHLQAQLRDQESLFGMEILGIGLCQTVDSPPLKNNFVDVASRLSSSLPDLEVQIVAKEVADNDAELTNFFNALATKSSIIDNSIVSIDDVEQQIVLFRTLAGNPPIPQPPSELTPTLPDYATGILGASNGVPWGKCERIPGMDAYIGMMPDRSRLFRNLRDPDGNSMNVLYYECKFDIDNDGSGGNADNDPFHQSDTSLHDVRGQALNASKVPFAVVPLDRSQSKVKRPGLCDFGKGLGLGIGDVGIAFWRGNSRGTVRSCPFIYGDAGPANKIGEGSVHLANALGINSDPVSGGLDSSTIRRLGKGIAHIAFPGSGRASLIKGRVLKSALIPDQIQARAEQLFASFLHQS